MSLRNKFTPATGSNRLVHTDKVQLGRSNGEGALIEPHPDNPTGALVNMKGVYAYEDELTAPSIAVSQLRSRPDNDLVAELSNNELLGQIIRSDLVDVSSLVVQGENNSLTQTILDAVDFSNSVVNGGFTEFDGSDFDNWVFEDDSGTGNLTQVNSGDTASGFAAQFETESGATPNSTLTQTIDVSENGIYLGQVQVVGGSSGDSGTVRILDSSDNVLASKGIEFDGSPEFITLSTIIAPTSQLKLQIEAEETYTVQVGDASLTRQQNDTLSLDFGDSSQMSLHIGTGGSANRGSETIALGADAGGQQLDGAIAIGSSAGSESQSENAVAIGSSAGRESQKDRSVAIGLSAGSVSQSENAVALGSSAGSESQSTNAIAIGSSAGRVSQSENAVAIGRSAGSESQSENAVALGTNAGRDSQQERAVAIGISAGLANQGQRSIAIGDIAGLTNLTDFSIAIGSQAGRSDTEDKMVILNASGSRLPNVNQGTVQSNSFYVRPIRGVAHGVGAGVLRYSNGTGEITYSTN